MKTIGKIAALAMTLSLAFVLTACGGSASSSAASSSASASAASSSASASAESASASADSASASTSAESASASAESASASAESASASAESASASTAAADADTYENQFFSINYHLPEGWSFADVSAIKGNNDVISKASENAELDMVAVNADQSQIVVVGIESPSDENAGKTAEDYLDAQVEAMESALEGNYSYSTTSASITFEGIERELPAAVTNLDVNGAKLSICHAVAEKEGAFFNVIAMGATQDEVVKAFESFAAVTQ